MNKIRSLIVFIVLFAVLLSGLNVYAGSGVYTAQDKSTFADRVKLLQDIGIIPENQSCNITTTITRAEFAKIILTTFGYRELGESKTESSEFTDVSKDNKYIGYINTAAAVNILQGFADCTFKPDEYITYEDAVKSFVQALGYKPLVKDNSATGFISIASEIGLLDNIKGFRGYPITFDELTKMFVNALDIDFMKQTGLGNGEKYAVVKNSNILTDILKLKKITGIVTATEDTDLIKNKYLPRNTIEIDGISYDVQGDYTNLLGYKIEFYTKLSENEILHIKVLDKNNLKRINAEDIISFENKTYKYYDSGKKCSVSVPLTYYMIFNGRALSNYTDADMVPANGWVTLIDNDDDNQYDVVFIKSFESYVVQSIDKDNDIIYDKYDSSKTIELNISNSNNHVKITDTTGEKLKFDSLKQWDVLSVAKSMDGVIVDIIVSREVARGKIKEIESLNDNSFESITIDNVKYEVHKNYFYGTNIKVGKSGIFRLNKDKKIVAFSESTDEETKIGYMVSAQMSNEGVEEKIVFKIFSTEGKMKFYYGAKTVNIDNQYNQSYEAFLNILKKGTDTVMSQVIEYKVNSNGEISDIDTPYNNFPLSSGKNYLTVTPENGESDKSFRVLYSTLLTDPGTGKAGFYGGQMSFRGRVNISSSTLVFVVPKLSRDADDSAYQFVTSDYFQHNSTYPIEAYSIGDNNLVADIIIVPDVTSASGDFSNGEKVGLISKRVESIDSEGNPITKMKLYNYDGETEVFTDDEDMVDKAWANNTSDVNTYTLEEGDIIRYSANRNGKLLAAQILVDESQPVYEKQAKFNPIAKIYTDDYRYILGFAYEKNSNAVDITSVNLPVYTGKITRADLEIQTASQIYICKKSDNGVICSRAKISDVMDYITYGERCSKIFMYTNYTEPRLTVIYKGGN